MVLSFSTNPYNNCYAANLKEFISFYKAAKQDFHLETHYNLLTGNANSFAANLKKLSKQFGYGFLLNIPTTCQTDATDANTFAYSNQIHMLETWNRVTDKHIAINANKIWGKAIGLAEQIPTIKLQNWLRLEANCHCSSRPSNWT
jgi:hypothetical protein